jgi:superfamily II DNA helicase RecQ
VAYADSAGCLRATILRYFGDPAARESCGACGNCGRRAWLDAAARLLVRKILSGIARAGERYGRRKITAMLVGNLEDLPEPLTRLSTTGLLRDEQPRAIEGWIEAACAAGLIRASDDHYRILSLTPQTEAPYLRRACLPNGRIMSPRCSSSSNRFVPAATGTSVIS